MCPLTVFSFVARTRLTHIHHQEVRDAVRNVDLLEAGLTRGAAKGAVRVDAGRVHDGALALLDQVFRDEWGRVLASLIGFLGDFDLAEEATAEAFATAAERWSIDGAPGNPGAWLLVTARNRAIDGIRRERTLVEKTRMLEVPEATVDELNDVVVPDERVELIFTCCHPALAIEGQLALTLRALGGLTTQEIARAFLVSEETMKRRLSRAKAKIKATGIPFSVPGRSSCQLTARASVPRTPNRRARTCVGFA